MEQQIPITEAVVIVGIVFVVLWIIALALTGRDRH